MLAVVTYLHSSLLSGTSCSLPPDCRVMPFLVGTVPYIVTFRGLCMKLAATPSDPRAAFIEIENRGLA